MKELEMWDVFLDEQEDYCMVIDLGDADDDDDQEISFAYSDKKEEIGKAKITKYHEHLAHDTYSYYEIEEGVDSGAFLLIEDLPLSINWRSEVE
jgi:hypothetical protein